MGSSRPRNSTRVGKARSARSLPRSRRKPAPKPLKVPESLPIPIAVELAIHRERETLITSITLLFSLHCILRRQLEGLGEVNEPVESAAKWVNVTELTTILLGKLHTVLNNLDEIALA